MLFLDFYPQSRPPQALPTCTWNGYTLWENAQSAKPLELSALPFDQAMKSIFHNLTFTELCEIVRCAETQKIQVPFEGLFAAYQFRYDNKLEKTIRLYLLFPTDVRDWCHTHSLSPKDLYPLTASPWTNEVAALLEKLVSLRPTRSQGAQAMELLADCVLLEKPNSAVLENSSTITDWLTHLHNLRYPKTHTSDSVRQKTLLSGWPKVFSTRWLRQGDRSGVEVKFFVGSKKELSEKIATLSRVHDGWTDDER